MKPYDLFESTDESRAIFRELRATIIRFKIYEWDFPLMRIDTHKFCLKYARKSDLI